MPPQEGPMRFALGILAATGISLLPLPALAQTPTAGEVSQDDFQVSLTVPSGVPLRLYLAKKVSKRAGAPVEAKLLEPVYAFDREVLPAGTVARGAVNRTQPVGKWQRA